MHASFDEGTRLELIDQYAGIRAVHRDTRGKAALVNSWLVANVGKHAPLQWREFYRLQRLRHCSQANLVQSPCKRARESSDRY